MLNLIKKIFKSEEKIDRNDKDNLSTTSSISPPLLDSKSEPLKWPSPIAQKVLDDLDKCPAWEWYNCFSHYSQWSGDHYEYRQHPYLNYRLTDGFSIEGISLDYKDAEFIGTKFKTQASSSIRSRQLANTKKSLAKLGFDYETVKPWLTYYE